MRKLKVPSTTRASCYFYNNTRDEIDRMVDILLAAKKFFAP